MKVGRIVRVSSLSVVIAVAAALLPGVPVVSLTALRASASPHPASVLDQDSGLVENPTLRTATSNTYGNPDDGTSTAELYTGSVNYQDPQEPTGACSPSITPSCPPHSRDTPFRTRPIATPPISPQASMGTRYDSSLRENG